MKKIRLRHANNVDLTQTFSASIRGGGGVRGFTDAMALETHSNDIYPTVKTVNFCVIVEVSDESE